MQLLAPVLIFDLGARLAAAFTFPIRSKLGETRTTRALDKTEGKHRGAVEASARRREAARFDRRVRLTSAPALLESA